MSKQWPVSRMVLCFLICASSFVSSLAQTVNSQSADPQQRQTARDSLNKYIYYLGLETKVSAADLDQLADLKVEAETASNPTEQRQKAYKELASRILRWQGGDPARFEQPLTAWSLASANTLASAANAPTWTKETTPLGQLGRVEQLGNGPIPMILISGITLDTDIYKEFMEANKANYTMYAVTLPGIGGTPPYALPERRNFTQMPWLTSIKDALVKLINEKRLVKPIVVGSFGGDYLAMRLALDYPDKIRAAIVLNGLVKMPMNSNLTPGKPAGIEERRNRVNQGIGPLLGELSPPRAKVSREVIEKTVENPPVQLRNALNGNTRNLERGKQLYIKSQVANHPLAARYNPELATTDLTEDLKNLKTPMLVIPAIPDDNVVPAMTSVIQWQEIKTLYPSIPMTMVPFEDTRAAVALDRTAELSKAIEAFLAGKPIDAPRREVAGNRVSPRAALMQAIATTEVRVSYSRPQVKDRKLGQLIQPGQVWRFGANESTTISFNTDVLIEGQKLPAGKYAVFAIPTETEWTVIFNKVVIQWGAFTYNADFDVLRVKVLPKTAEHQECMSFEIEDLTLTSANLVMRWEKLKLPLQIATKTAS